MFIPDDKQQATARLAWRMHTSSQGPMPSELAIYVYKLMDHAGVSSLDSHKQFCKKIYAAMERGDVG